VEAKQSARALSFGEMRSTPRLLALWETGQDRAIARPPEAICREQPTVGHQEAEDRSWGKTFLSAFLFGKALFLVSSGIRSICPSRHITKSVGGRHRGWFVGARLKKLLIREPRTGLCGLKWTPAGDYDERLVKIFRPMCTPVRDPGFWSPAEKALHR